MKKQKNNIQNLTNLQFVVYFVVYKFSCEMLTTNNKLFVFEHF